MSDIEFAPGGALEDARHLTRAERLGPAQLEEVEEKMLMTPGDISMLLNETAGLRVQPTARPLDGAGVRIQGLRGGIHSRRTFRRS